MSGAVAIILARGGSTRVPRKNVREFCGKPMIAWPIEAAIASDCFARVLVSTDDPEIASVAHSCGADVPFVRPAALADEHTMTRDVVRHALSWLAENESLPDLACSLYGTAAFVRAGDLIAGREALSDPRFDFAFSATTFPYPIQRALRNLPNGGVELVRPQYINARSQDLEETIHDAGQFYWGRTAPFVGGDVMFSERGKPIMIPRSRVVDIDTEEDWRQAELMFSVLRGKKGS